MAQGEKGGHKLPRKRYNRKECRERGSAALAVAVIAAVLLAGTSLYVHSQTSGGRNAHINLYLVVADVAMPLLAGWLVWDWLHYRRELRRSKSAPCANGSKGKRRHKRRR